MHKRMSGGFLANLFGTGERANAAEVARASGLARRAAHRMSPAIAEALESRVLLAGDHPSIPGTFSPTAGTLLTLDSASPSTNARLGRALTAGNEGVSGTIASGDDGDFFRFVMPSTPGRPTDFVTVLADTQTRPDGSDLNSTLDTYVEVYRANPGNNGYQLISAGANNGILSSSATPTPDGWVGFVGTAGTTYFIRVRTNPGTLAPGRTATGDYTLRVDAVSIDYAIDSTPQAMVPPDPATDIFGEGDVAGTIAFRQDDLVYRVTTPNTSEFDSLATVGVIADDAALLNTHLEVYDSGNMSGVVSTLVSDQQAGRLTNAFGAFRAAPGTTYFIRVRSDEVAAGRPATGAFTLAVDMSALEIGVDQTTRLSVPDRADAISPLIGSNAPGGTSSRIYQFTAQGTGIAFITAVGAGGVAFTPFRAPGGPPGAYPALTDPAIHLYNDSGIVIAFNDDTSGFTPQLAVSLTGGQRYYLLVEGFDRNVDGGFSVFIEANYTNTSVDDHVDSTPTNILNFQNATPIVFGTPTLLADADRNSVLDRDWFQTGTSRGRIYQPGDTDLFQFTPPVSTLDQYDGDSGGQGRALYVGGNFGNADRLNVANPATFGRGAPNVAIWDADDWWNAGPGEEGMGLDPQALNPLNSPTQSALNGPIFAMTEWDPDGDGTEFGTVLVAGGNFRDFDGNTVNIAMRVFKPSENRFVWSPIPGLVFDNPADVVQALTVFDLDTGATGTPDLPPRLIVGGRFTSILGGTVVNNIVAFGRFQGAWVFETLTDGGIGLPGAGAEVRALTVWDPPAPYTMMGAMTQNPDPPAGLYIGGIFSRAGVTQSGTGSQTSQNIIRFGLTGDSAAMPPVNRFAALGTGTNAGAGGAVNALTTWTFPTPPAGQPATALILGGAFTTAGGVAGANVIAYGNGPSNGAMMPGPSPLYFAIGGAAGVVHALTTWRPPTTPGSTGMDQLLVIGGVGPDGGVVSLSNGAARLDEGFNAPVRSLTVFTDDEFDVSGSEIIYAGGDFTRNSNSGNIPFNGVAKFDDQNHDGGFTWMPLKGGVQDLAPGEIGTTSVRALSSFDDNVAGTWDRNERPASRVTIRITLPTDPATGATDSFLDSTVRVFDSNFNIIYTNETIAPPFPNPSGSIDPANTAGPGFNTAFVMPGLWAGEVYYIEVSGNGTGRYNISVTTDAIAPENPDNLNGRYVGVNRTIFEIPDEGQFPLAPELDLNTNGDGRAFDLLTPTGRQALNGWDFKRTPGSRSQGGILRSERDFLAGIESPADTDLYQFRASATGTVEIRISTLGIIDQFIQTTLTQTPAGDFVFNTGGAFTTTMQMDRADRRQYNSPLDAALKVFNNDFVLLGSNDDSFAVEGFGHTFQAGIHPDRTQGGAGEALLHAFLQRDPRVVIPVVAGETYFIQVESAFRDLFLTDPGMVDWRHATGSYELLINNTQSSNGIDDFENYSFFGPLAISSAIPTDIATGRGFISGIIDNVESGAFINPDDTDMFSFIVVNRGQVSFRVDATSPSLRPNITLFDAAGQSLGSSTAEVNGGTATVNLNAARQGERIFIRIDGDGITEGSYNLTVQGQGITDDHVKDGAWPAATPLSLNAFLGEYRGSGFIENPSDSDTFVFTAQAYEIATVTVTAAPGSSLNPFVFVWEVSSNAANPMDGIPEWRLVAANDNGPGLGNNSRATFSVTAGRQYYIVVYGASPATDFGRYNLAVAVTASDDHPNLADFPLATQLDLSATFNPLTFTASASATGRIEVLTDDDMFRFVAPSGGTVTATVTTPGSNLAGDVFVYDANQTLLGTGTAVNGTATVTVNISANLQYFVRVAAGTAGAGQPDLIGGYTLTVETAPVDDYANEGEFSAINVGIITLNSATGVGSLSGIIVPDTDTDLFRFSTLAAGNVQIRVTTVGSVFNPRIRVFNSAFVEIPGASSNGDTASLTFPATGAAEVYYILVLPNVGATGLTAVGSYTVQVTGTRPGGGPGPNPGDDDHADAGEFGDATLILLNSRTGFGSGSGVINFGGDTDLFKFVPAASGRTGVLVKTPSGGLVDGRIKIFNKNFTLIAEDAAGLPGATAAITFNAIAGNPDDVYFILVEPIGSATGSYTVETSTQPVTHFLYYPEGFSASTIDEFVPIVNPNNFAVTYQVFVRYESGAQNNNPIASGTIAPTSRGGITVSRKTGDALVDRGRPYALEIRSSGQLGATMSHYDFNVSVGEAFTNRVSTTWTFAQVNKDRTTFRDFLVFYNPFDVAADLTITLTYGDGATTTFNQTVGALRRGGINIDADGRVARSGRFGVTITSSNPIVAALSSYNLVNGGGDGLLGDPDGGTTAGVIPDVIRGGGVTSTLSFLNTNPTPATITITASYARVDLPDLIRVITVQPNRQFSISLAALGIINNQAAGLRYTSSVPVTASVIKYQNGDGDTTAAATEAALQYTFGDLFVSPRSAGVTYKERLGVFNPSDTSIDVVITFLFVDGTSSSTIVNVPSRDFAFVQIDQQTAILSRTGPTAFSLLVSSPTPIVASLTHYDLFLNGGWGTLGSPIGLTIPLSTLI